MNGHSYERGEDMKEHLLSEEFDMEKELEMEFIHEMAEFFKIFGDGTRIRILQTLLEGEKNVGELAEALEMSQSAVSHQLRVLRQNDLVKYRKEGKVVFYSLDDEHVENVLQQGMAHLRHKRGYHE
ncbi:MAG: helix-turn-helix transcriptional regulator [Anaerotignum sp.]|nr:helix-turn-helix transcriptional regulator [Anaerotignum sp.]